MIRRQRLAADAPWALHKRVLAAPRLRERDYVPYGFLAQHYGNQPVKAQRNARMGRTAGSEDFEKMGELCDS